MAKRQGIWVPELQVGQAVAAGGNSGFTLLNNLDATIKARGGYTVTRIIGNVSFSPNSISRQSFAMAIMLTHDQQSVAEPKIKSDISANLLWTWLGLTNGMFLETSSGVFTRVDERVYFDVRVQRKIPANFSLAFVIQNETGVALQVTVGARTRILLP